MADRSQPPPLHTHTHTYALVRAHTHSDHLLGRSRIAQSHTEVPAATTPRSDLVTGEVPQPWLAVQTLSEARLLAVPSTDHHVRQEDLKPGNLKGPDRIYCSLEEAEIWHLECPQTEEHIGGHDLQQPSSMGCHPGAGRSTHLSGCWLNAEVLGLHPDWHIARMHLDLSSHIHLVQVGRVTGPRERALGEKDESSCLVNSRVFLQEGRNTAPTEELCMSQAKARVQNHSV